MENPIRILRFLTQPMDNTMGNMKNETTTQPRAVAERRGKA